MYKFIFLLVRYLVAAPAFAFDDGCLGGNPDPSLCSILPPDPGSGSGATAPEPEVISLLGIGALAFLVARRIKKL